MRKEFLLHRLLALQTITTVIFILFYFCENIITQVRVISTLHLSYVTSKIRSVAMFVIVYVTGSVSETMRKCIFVYDISSYLHI
jgi:hypothetical protein